MRRAACASPAWAALRIALEPSFSRGTSSSVLRGNDGASRSAWRIRPVPDAWASKQPTLPQPQMKPPSGRIVWWPNSPAPFWLPSASTPRATKPPPIPVPSVEQREVLRALPDAVRVLAQRRAARVVADEHRVLRKRGAHAVAERNVRPAEVGRVADGAADGIDVAGRADADRDDVVLGRVDRALHDVRERVDDGGRRAVGDVVLELRVDLAGLVDRRRHHVRAAEVDADRRARRHAVGSRDARGARRAGATDGRGAGVGGATPGGGSTTLDGSFHLS